MKHPKNQLIAAPVATLIHIILTALLVTGFPNIRIQVNNDNLQNPPYLLEALKQAQAIENAAAAASVAPVSSASRIAAAAPLAPPSEGPNNLRDGVKEEAIEAVLDLQPESVLKLSPESLIDAVVDRERGKSEELLAEAASSHHHEENSQADNQEGQHSAGSLSLDSGVQPPPKQQEPLMPSSSETIARTPQLPVTNSHLKRPTSGLLATEGVSETGASGSVEALDVDGKAHSGAKSLVSPSVLNEGDSIPAINLNKAKLAIGSGGGASGLADTLEPNQVMSGVTNASLVPATVTREYSGTQSRTKVILGGGYVRQRQPPLGIEPSAPQSSSGALRDNRLPVTPPAQQRTPVQNDAGLTEEAYEDESAGSVSRVVEVPERIVVSESVFEANKPSASGVNQRPNQMQQQRPQRNPSQNIKRVTASQVTSSEANQNQTPIVTKKLDKRCSSKGYSIMEHPTACDKYYTCEDGFLSEHTCPNGLLFGTRNPVRDYCINRWEAVCGEKTIPNPISSPGCRWQNGIFSVQGSPKCSPDFYECTDGVFEVKKCPISGQVYDDRTKSCKYAEQVGCAEEALADFQCPQDDQANTYWPFPRYFLNERALIHCIADKPQIIRCLDTERVDPEHLHCVPRAKKPIADTAAAAAGSPAEDDSLSTESVSARKAREKKKSINNQTAEQPNSSSEQ